MVLSRFFLDCQHRDPKLILLYRFHIVVILVNILAVIIDLTAERYENVWIEAGTVLFLCVNVWKLRQKGHVQVVVYLFLSVIATALFAHIWFNHFGTMSVIFVLLLPLTTMLFIPISYSFLIELIMVAVMALLLYLEYQRNPANPIFQNPKALFHLAYAALIIFLFGLLYHFSIHKTLEELDNSNQQRGMLLKEVHHRVKNNLNVIASIIGLQAGQLDTKEQEELNKSKIRIESIAIVHEMLYRSEDLTGIDVASYVHKLSKLLFKMYGRHHTVSVEIESDETTLPLETMIQLGIMINEMLTNSIKYAFKKQNNQNAFIRMTFHQKEEKVYHFSYEDNGEGIYDTEELNKSKSLGIKLIHLTVKQLRGTVKISSPKGLKYDIRFEV